MSESDRPEAPEEQETAGTDSNEEVHEEGPIVHLGGEEEGPVGGEASVDQVAEELGVIKYVQAAFFLGGIISAYLSGKILLAAWNTLADWPEAVRAVPALIEYTEDERGSLTLFIGAVVGVLLVLRYYRRPAVKSWATDVAGELARVTWPGKDIVTSGTIVVLIAGAIATLYVAVLDRLWGYLTNLIYGT